MAAPQYLPLYIGDYLRDTLHLTTEQHGAYLLLLMACWTHGRLPNDNRKLAAIARLSTRRHTILCQILYQYFFLGDDGFWHQNRIDRERQHIEKVKKARSKSGSKGLAKRWQNHLQSIAIASKPEPNFESSTKPTETQSRAHAREEAVDKIDERDPVGRFAPLARSRSPHLTDALKANRKELLRQKLIRFADDRLAAADRSAAIAGLSGADPEHTDQWWLDTLDQRMRAERWDDAR